MGLEWSVGQWGAAGAQLGSSLTSHLCLFPVATQEKEEEDPFNYGERGCARGWVCWQGRGRVPGGEQKQLPPLLHPAGTSPHVFSLQITRA